MAIRVNKKLNLVIPVELDNGTNVWVHSTPVGREVFETYFRNFSRVFNELYTGGHGISAPRVAFQVFKDDAIRTGTWEGKEGVGIGLFNEIWRLTNILHPGEKGWDVTPFEDAIRKSMLNEEDIHELKNILVYFIVASVMHKRADLELVLDGLLSRWGAQFTQLNCMEYITSLQTLTTEDNSGEKAKASSIPV